MIQITDKSQCSGCHACASACPQNCIRMVCDEEGFLYPQIEEDKCVRCGLCIKSCPILTPTANRFTEEDVKAYAARAKDEEIRLKSSSGGLFTEIASYVIARGGVVFGAAFEDDFQVAHIAVETVAELAKLRGSKYVQSTIGTTYKDAKEYLDKGRMVLFSGTPCQIGGLRSFLKKEYDNLLTVDIICHGVPSPAVWGKYLREVGTPKEIQFREKCRGWHNYSLLIKTDRKKICESRYKNAMIRVFIGNMCLRPSCHECSFKGFSRQSDITLADFWGIQNIFPEMDDNKGTSLVITNTGKGAALLSEIKDRIVIRDADFSAAVSYNTSYSHAAHKPALRQNFMRELADKSVHQLADKYCREKWIKSVKRSVKQFLNAINVCSK